MKRSNFLLSLGIGITLLATPYETVLAAAAAPGAAYQKGIEGHQKALAAQNADGASTNFAIGSCYDYYPLAVDNVQGLKATLEVSNLDDTSATFDICAVPAGTTEYSCRNNVAFNPRDARFFDMPSISGAFKNTVGQLYVFTNSLNGAAGSQLILFAQDGSVAAIVNPTEFCP